MKAGGDTKATFPLSCTAQIDSVGSLGEFNGHTCAVQLKKKSQLRTTVEDVKVIVSFFLARRSWALMHRVLISISRGGDDSKTLRSHEPIFYSSRTNV